MIRIITFTLLLLAISFDAMADGKMYYKEKVPPSIPYQRALIVFKNGVETLVLQSRYEIPSSASKEPLGWVVPVPSLPELASMPANWAQDLFFWLSWISKPQIHHLKNEIVEGIIIGTFSLLLLITISFILPIPERFKAGRIKLFRLTFLVFVLAVAIELFLMTFTSYGVRGSNDVEVVSAQRVGVYDVKVIRATSAKELVSWLNANGFNYGAEDISAYESYITKGWCFVAAKLNPTKEDGNDKIAAEGLAAPLILRFPHKSPVYPVALTATGNHKTEILIYLVTDTKMQCDNRLKLWFAGTMRSKLHTRPFYLISSATNGYMHSIPVATESNLSSTGITPKGFFKADDLDLSYICKFKQTLTPDEMREDIVFKPAQDKSDYRERIIKW